MRLNKKDGLNIVPFIDIMLVLLAIVLSISTFIAQGKIAIDLPSANSAEQSKEDDKKVSVVIDILKEKGHENFAIQTISE